MIRLVVRALVFFGSAAVGLLVAAWLLDDVSVSAEGFLVVVLVFALIQTVISPFIARVGAKNATVLLGGVGLLSTAVALIAASWVGDALRIEGGLSSWIAATVIVWLGTALATLLLPLVLVRIGRQRADERLATRR